MGLPLTHLCFVTSRALENLNYLGALNDDGDLTALGAQMCKFPLEPQLTRAILGGVDFKCSNEMLTIAACLSAGSQVFLRPPSEGKAGMQRRDPHTL